MDKEFARKADLFLLKACKRIGSDSIFQPGLSAMRDRARAHILDKANLRDFVPDAIHLASTSYLDIMALEGRRPILAGWPSDDPPKDQLEEYLSVLAKVAYAREQWLRDYGQSHPVTIDLVEKWLRHSIQAAIVEYVRLAKAKPSGG